ncbi:MAG TPA: hypothetical protein VMH85_18410 [Terriglobales bacterium]|nr:hypothetical protein [Terriglobales bacterium]
MQTQSSGSYITKDLILGINRLWSQTDGGVFDSLECPSCHHRSVSIWFTHPRADQYRTWFICKQCRLEARFINSGPPKNYTEARINEHLQAHDSECLARARFPWPPR